MSFLDKFKKRNIKEQPKKNQNIGDNSLLKENTTQDIILNHSKNEVEDIKYNSDGLILVKFKEFDNPGDSIEAMNNYTDIVLSYERKAELLEKSGKIDEATEIFEKLINEYRFGGSFPYNSLVSIYNNQEKYEDTIRVCDLAIKNLGHSEYLVGNKLMINPQVTHSGTDKKVKNFEEFKKEAVYFVENKSVINEIKIAQQLEENNEIEEAIKIYENIIKTKYPKKLPYHRLCILYRKKKNYQQELNTCNKAIENLTDTYQKRWFEERKIKVLEKIEKSE